MYLELNRNQLFYEMIKLWIGSGKGWKIFERAIMKT